MSDGRRPHPLSGEWMETGPRDTPPQQRLDRVLRNRARVYHSGTPPNQVLVLDQTYPLRIAMPFVNAIDPALELLCTVPMLKRHKGTIQSTTAGLMFRLHVGP